MKYIVRAFHMDVGNTAEDYQRWLNSYAKDGFKLVSVVNWGEGVLSNIFEEPEN